MISIEKQKEFPRQTLKQNIHQSNSALQAITNIEDTNQYHVPDKKVHFMSTKNLNPRWDTKHNEELQPTFHQSADSSVCSNSTALITIQTKINYQHNQEPLVSQTPALKQGWGTNTSSSARWKRVGRTGLGPPKRAERLSSESAEGFENTTEVENVEPLEGVPVRLESQCCAVWVCSMSDVVWVVYSMVYSVVYNVGGVI
ncbi:unnamed protein product [Pneumocystis jirovecii]|uniref:Uncharacterized protein n=1 Tax=Pneumocystis jirovecii TaxID=42068 RepID=L0PGT8_PNEJI|nr:unnamed protein product [Pneumocystis jirovecii]